MEILKDSTIRETFVKVARVHYVRRAFVKEKAQPYWFYAKKQGMAKGKAIRGGLAERLEIQFQDSPLGNWS